MVVDVLLRVWVGMCYSSSMLSCLSYLHNPCLSMYFFLCAPNVPCVLSSLCTLRSLYSSNIATLHIGVHSPNSVSGRAVHIHLSSSHTLSFCSLFPLSFVLMDHPQSTALSHPLPRLLPFALCFFGGIKGKEGGPVLRSWFQWITGGNPDQRKASLDCWDGQMDRWGERWRPFHTVVSLGEGSPQISINQ